MRLTQDPVSRNAMVPPMKIDVDTVRRVAKLAHLELEEAEIADLQRDMDAILGYIDTLGELDTSDVAPTTHVLEIETPLRADEVSGVLSPEEAVRNAPEHTDSAMVVPKVLD